MARIRVISAKKRDRLSSRESVTRMEAPGWMCEMRKDAAETGAPAHARTLLSPIERRRVLFPDMFEPDKMSKRTFWPSSTWFPTATEAGRSGCFRSSASNRGDEWGSNSGKHQFGCSKDKAAKDERASSSATARSHSARFCPECARQDS